MDRGEDRLARAFEALSAESPRSAPPELGTTLKDAFRRHHVRRRRRHRVLGALAFAACLIAVALVVSRSRSVQPEQRQSTLAARQAEETQPSRERRDQESVRDEPPSEQTHYHQSAVQTHQPAVARLHKPGRAPLSSSPTSGKFVSLPSYDPTFSQGGFKIVRVGLTGADFVQLGAPQPNDLAGRRVLADVMLDRDGIPVAVRTVGR